MDRIRLNISWRGTLTALFLYAVFLLGIIGGASYANTQYALSQEKGEIFLTAEKGPSSDGLLIITADQQGQAQQQQEEEEPKDKIPAAVIYCTHASEEYSGQKRVSGVAGGVQQAAAVLAERLESHGIKCIFLQQVFDAPDWNNAYGNSLAALEQVKEEYPNMELFIDIHRDSPVEGLDTHYNNGGKAYARMMLIIGSDANLEHPYWEQNRDFAYSLDNWLDEKYSGLMRDPRIYSGRYNQHMGKKAILVEIGSTENTQEEAANSAALLADAIAACIGGF